MCMEIISSSVLDARGTDFIMLLTSLDGWKSPMLAETKSYSSLLSWSSACDDLMNTAPVHVSGSRRTSPM